MNKEYVYKDGKALIIDEFDNQKIVEYYDNLEEVLVEENLIEKIQEEIKKLEKETSQYKKRSKFLKILLIWGPFLLWTFGPLIIDPIIWNFLGANLEISTTLFKTINLGTFLGLISMPLFAVVGSLTALLIYSKIKGKEQSQKGKETQLEFLRRNLVEQNEILEKLKLEKTNSLEKKDFYLSKIDNKEALKKLKNFLSLYYTLGYNEEKYFKYYQKRILDNHLEKFENDEIPLVYQYFEEKGPTLEREKNI